eukprot:Em0115g4a
MCYSCYNIYSIFNPSQCSSNANQQCLVPAYENARELELWVYTSNKLAPSNQKDMDILFRKPLRRGDNFTEQINVTLPSKTLHNGTLYAHVYLGPRGKHPVQHQQHVAAATVPMTRYSVPEVTAFNLLSGENQNSSHGQPLTHWIPTLSIHSLLEDWKFDRMLLPGDLWRSIFLVPGTSQYLPILYVDRMKTTTADLKYPLSKEMPLDVSYSPVGIGQLRLWLVFSNAMKQMESLGFTDREFDDIKGIFLGSPYLLGLTVFVSTFHLLFDFLAFKNDISFWRKRRNMVGLSTRAVLWRCFSQAVIFLYLMDEKTSLLVLVPAGVATVIEFWKVRKALKIQLHWTGIIPRIKLGDILKVEQETEQYDSQAMRYLSYALYPLVLIGAVYSLFYSSYKSWYSFIIHTLVNGVYAFGFIFMLPQLFVNYKMKSVAHLPWRAFMYKAFNTFIDDVFAFMIVMPTSHRIAVFRDDLVFLVYLYQRWLYPVDKTRVNEFGESFEEDKKSLETKKEN